MTQIGACAAGTVGILLSPVTACQMEIAPNKEVVTKSVQLQDLGEESALDMTQNVKTAMPNWHGKTRRTAIFGPITM